MNNDFKNLIAKNILLEAKIEDMKKEIADLKRHVRIMCRTFEQLEELGIPEVDEILDYD
jgi:hypothetical protein